MPGRKGLLVTCWQPDSVDPSWPPATNAEALVDDVPSRSHAASCSCLVSKRADGDGSCLGTVGGGVIVALPVGVEEEEWDLLGVVEVEDLLLRPELHAQYHQ